MVNDPISIAFVAERVGTRTAHIPIYDVLDSYSDIAAHQDSVLSIRSLRP